MNQDKTEIVPQASWKIFLTLPHTKRISLDRTDRADRDYDLCFEIQQRLLKNEPRPG